MQIQILPRKGHITHIGPYSWKRNKVGLQSSNKSDYTDLISLSFRFVSSFYQLKTVNQVGGSTESWSNSYFPIISHTVVFKKNKK